MSAFVTLPKLDLGRRLARGLALEDVTRAVALERQRWQADGVLHGELIVDLRDWTDTQAALVALDAGMQPEDPQAPWSYALIVALDAPWPELVEVVEDADVTSVRGVLATRAADRTQLGPFWQTVKSAGWLRMVEAETATELQQAWTLGFDRLLGASALARLPDLLTTLRAHRLPVAVSPSAQIAAGDVASWPQHPIQTLTNAGVTTVLASGWPQTVTTTLSGELEALSRHHHWKLDQLRTLMTRNAEAAAIRPEARFGIARQIEAWRHRPHPTAGPKGDPWSL